MTSAVDTAGRDAVRKVSVVDDDVSVRNSVKRLLRAARYTVTAFSCAADFLASGDCSTSDCAILDVRLPGMDGLTLQEKLTASGSRVPVIIITAGEDIAIEERALKNGAVEFFRKPFPGNALLDAVRTALKGTGGPSAECGRGTP